MLGGGEDFHPTQGSDDERHRRMPGKIRRHNDADADPAKRKGNDCDGGHPREMRRSNAGQLERDDNCVSQQTRTATCCQGKPADSPNFDRRPWTEIWISGYRLVSVHGLWLSTHRSLNHKPSTRGRSNHPPSSWPFVSASWQVLILYASTKLLVKRTGQQHARTTFDRKRHRLAAVNRLHLLRC